MGAVAPFTEEETGVLDLSPFHVFFLVAGADGKIDQKEFESFVHGLMDRGAGSEDIVSAVFANSGRYFDSYHQQARSAVVVGGAKASLKHIRVATDLLDDKLDGLDSLRFKRSLFKLGQRVAQASGGMLGMGGKVSAVEQAALGSLSGILGVRE